MTHEKRENMFGGVFSRITFKLRNFIKEVGQHWRPILIMEKRIIEKLARIREVEAIHISKQWRISGHTCTGSTDRVTFVKNLVTTLVSSTHIIS